jgi:hypothetical protein
VPAGPDGSPLALTGLVVVVEGRARDAAAPPGVRLVRAPGSGDDALAAEARALTGEQPGELLVVTADRGLRARLPPGVAVTGPGWLLRVLDQLAAPDGDGSS